MLTLTVTLESNWHIGTGEGSPITDAVLYRIGGQPAIPASQLKDIIREHSAAIATTLGFNEQLVPRIFGTPGSIRGSWAWGSACAQAGEIETVISRHHRRDRATGVVPADGLFDMEIARPCSLVAECEPHDSAEAQLDELLLVMIASATVRRVGIRRNRGFGHCRIEPSWSGKVREAAGAEPSDCSIESVADAFEELNRWSGAHGAGGRAS